MDFNEMNEGTGQEPENKVRPESENSAPPVGGGENTGFMPHTQSQEKLYRGAGVGRKEDFSGIPSGKPQQDGAAPQNPEQKNSVPWNYPGANKTPEKPQPVKRVKAPAEGSKTWLTVLISGGIAAAVAILICILVASAMNTYWQEQNAQLTQSYQEKLDAVQNQLEKEKTPAATTPDTALPDTPAETTPSTQPTTPTQPSPNTSGNLTPDQVYAKCVSSVVAIHGTATVNSYGQTMETSSSGSGFILSADGYVVTNYHVVEGQTKLKVSTYDGTSYNAAYIGGNEANDIALIKMDAQGLKPVTIGVSANLVVGEQVAAIGNALGELASTLTVGYISAKDRIVTTDGTQINMLQTDAAINPGNSGGPLFNMRGEVIGITSAKYSGTTSSGATIEGIGFAIPIDDVLGMLNDLREYGYITGGYLGVSVSDVDPEAAEMYGLPKGVLIREITAGSCAEKAGLQVQDIITGLGGYEVGNLNDLSRALNKFKAGDAVDVTVYRGGAEKTISVTLDDRPKDLSDSTTNTQPTTPSQPSGGGSIEDWIFDYFLP